MHPLLDPFARPVVGHRGASGLAPENTVQAFALALEQGADALEFDVRLSVDGVPIVLHDPTLARTCNRNETASGLSAREIGCADAGFRFSQDGGVTHPWRDRDVRVPTVAQVLDRFPETPLLIEVKEVTAAAPLSRLLRSRNESGRVVVASFLEQALQPFREDPPIPTGASRQGILRLWLSALFRLPAPRGDYSVYAVPDRFRERIHVPTRGFIAAARRRGCPVHVWTVDSPDRAEELWRRGAAGMITNYPGLLVARREELDRPSFPSGPGQK